MKTQIDIVTDLYKIVKGSELAQAVNGEVYHDGMRPRDSNKEDVIIRFTAAGDYLQQSEAVVTLLAYVPDIVRGKTGVRIPNMARLKEVMKACNDFVDNLHCKAYLTEEWVLSYVTLTDENDKVVTDEEERIILAGQLIRKMSDYSFRLKQTITYADDLEVEQHFVTMRLLLKYFEENA